MYFKSAVCGKNPAGPPQALTILRIPLTSVVAICLLTTRLLTTPLLSLSASLLAIAFAYKICSGRVQMALGDYEGALRYALENSRQLSVCPESGVKTVAGMYLEPC